MSAFIRIRFEFLSGLSVSVVSDLHKLFDLGYVTSDPRTRTISVSRKIREEFENGRDYYRLDGQPLRQPENELAIPSLEKLKYHYEHVYRG